jgi:hypothetical protein
MHCGINGPRLPSPRPRHALSGCELHCHHALPLQAPDYTNWKSEEVKYAELGSPRLLSAFSLRTEPRDLNASAAHIRAFYIGRKPAGARIDFSANLCGSTLTTYLLRGHFECSRTPIEAAIDASQRLHVVPGDYASQDIVRLHHDVPVHARTTATGTGMKDVDPARRKLYLLLLP